MINQITMSQMLAPFSVDSDVISVNQIIQPPSLDSNDQQQILHEINLTLSNIPPAPETIHDESI